MENTIDTIDTTGNKGLVFAMDIGTRSVVGIVGRMVDDVFEVVDYEQHFHAKRAMRDGQIEDITLVARVVNDVRSALEDRLGVSFKKVSIAAAGRSLKTIETEYSQDIEPTDEITELLMQGAEYSALSKAMDEFAQLDEHSAEFHCVGYSVVKFSLDDYNMSNLVGHKGSKITLSLIAAFLPHNVVEGLYATMTLNGLEVENLTLEPMAAIHVIVPKDIRLLNIALVDIGAGTSDIAICRNGGISAYDMVTVAGDELTEKLMQTYLVDFDQAEKMKLSLAEQGEETIFKDVLGFETTVSKAELSAALLPSIAELSKTIAQRIAQVNASSPVAVFIVGGGSQVPGLCEAISKHLDLPENRVTVGGRQGFKYVQLCDEKLRSPEFVTPIGIGAILSERAGADFFAITVNGNKIMLLRQGKIKVMEAILLAGIRPTALIGVPQRPIQYTVNGQKKVFRQEYTSGEITINGAIASIDSTLSRGDALVVVPAKMSEKDSALAGDIKRASADIKVSLRGIDHVLEERVEVNGIEVEDEYKICNDDVVVTKMKNTVRDFCKLIDIACDGKLFAVNGIDSDLDSILSMGDEISYAEIEGYEPPKAAESTEMAKSTEMAETQPVQEIKSDLAQEVQPTETHRGTVSVKVVPTSIHHKINVTIKEKSTQGNTAEEGKMAGDKAEESKAELGRMEENKTEETRMDADKAQGTPAVEKSATHLSLHRAEAARTAVQHDIKESLLARLEAEQSELQGELAESKAGTLKLALAELAPQTEQCEKTELNAITNPAATSEKQAPQAELAADTVPTAAPEKSSVLEKPLVSPTALAAAPEKELIIKPVEAEENGYVPYTQRSEKGYIFVTINGKPNKVKAESGDSVLFVHMLNYVHIENEMPGENLVLSINKKPAAYTDEVKDGDEVIIRWE